MELRAIVDVLRRWWWLVAIPTLMAGVATIPALPQVSQTSSGYGSVIHFSAAQRSTRDLPAEGGLEDVWLASELAVHAIAAWARTESFRRELDATPGVEPGDVAALAIASDDHRSIGQLFLNHPDAQPLLRLATAATEVLQNTSRRVGRRHPAGCPRHTPDPGAAGSSSGSPAAPRVGAAGGADPVDAGPHFRPRLAHTRGP